jgi:hypothetical protein
MKNKIKQIVLALGVLVIAGLSGCSKNGATGPAGPTGNANVSSQLSSINFTGWTGSANYYTYPISDAAIASSTSDAVMVYVEWTGALGDFYALPLSGAFVIGDNLSFDYVNGTLTLDYVSANSAAPNRTVMAKVVVIPPGMKAMHPQVNWKSYEQVKGALNLKD